jgi:hypothetical protein
MTRRQLRAKMALIVIEYIKREQEGEEWNVQMIDDMTQKLANLMENANYSDIDDSFEVLKKS